MDNKIIEVIRLLMKTYGISISDLQSYSYSKNMREDFTTTKFNNGFNVRPKQQSQFIPTQDIQPQQSVQSTIGQPKNSEDLINQWGSGNLQGARVVNLDSMGYSDNDVPEDDTI